MGVIKIPDYINDKFLIKTVLTKNKINSYKDYIFFTKLCSLNSEKIPFETAMQLSETTGDELTFINYLGRFTDKKLMVIRHSFKPEGLRPEYVFISNENSFEFIYEYINECIIQGLYDYNYPLPSFKELTYNNINIPKNNIENFTTEILYKKLQKKTIATPTIYSIPIYKDLFYFTDENIDKISDYAIIKLQKIFNSSPHVTNEILKLFKHNIQDFKTHTTSKDYKIWLPIIKEISKEIPSLRLNRKISDSYNFLDFIIILKNTLDTHITFIDEIAHTEKKLDNVKKEIESYFFQLTNGIDRENFEVFYNETIEKHELKEKKEILENQILQPLIIDVDKFEPNQQIYNIIDFKTYLIHSSMLPNCISEKYFSVNEKIHAIYLEIMKKFLLHKLPPKERIFFSIEELETSVRKHVQKIDNFMFTILQYPVVLANMIINNHNKKILEKNQDQQADMVSNEIEKTLFDKMSLSKQLSTFFNIRTKKLLKWHEIFNINVVQLATLSFSKLSFFQKLFLFITNRYKLTMKKIKKLNSSIEGGRESALNLTHKTQKFIQK